VHDPGQAQAMSEHGRARTPFRLHFVRHGQSTWNAEGRVQGQAAQVPLTAAGRHQAQAAARFLRGCAARHVFSSDLVRALETAAPIARILGVTPLPEPALREQSLGSLEGLLASDLTAQETPSGEHVTSIRWGGGESIADVHRRVGAFLSRLLAASPGQDIVLVTHSGTIRVAVACLRGLGPHEVDWLDVPNGSVTTVTCLGGRARTVMITAPGRRSGPIARRLASRRQE
jgi:broad specificity phosphatase PhoE